MKKLLAGLVFGLLLFGIGGVAQATLLYDQNVTPDVIFGSGNANGSFTVDQNNGIELGLRGKLRHDSSGSPQNIFNSNGDGTYSFNPGVAPTQSSPTAEWSFEWSINTDYLGSSGFTLDDYTYELGTDSDPTLGASFDVFDPINQTFPDHALGTNSTGNGDGVVATDAANYTSLLGSNNVAQNSWKPHWIFSTFDPTIDGTYDIYLAAFNANGGLAARTDIQIIVGQGGTNPIPEPATMLLFGVGLLGIAGVSRRKRA